MSNNHHHRGSEEEDGGDYIPESLRGFLAEAEHKLHEDLDSVLNFDDHGIPKAVPAPTAVFLEEDDDDQETEDNDDIFHRILDREQDEDLKQGLLEGLLEQPPNHPHGSSGVCADDTSFSSDFMSPPISDFMLNHNPAYEVTESQARHIAMEGVTPRGRGGSGSGGGTNLMSALDHVASPSQKQPPIQQLHSVEEQTPAEGPPRLVQTNPPPAKTSSKMSKAQKRRQRKKKGNKVSPSPAPVETLQSAPSKSSTMSSIPMSISVSEAPSPIPRTTQPKSNAAAAPSYVSDASTLTAPSLQPTQRKEKEQSLLSQAMGQWGKSATQGVTRRPISSTNQQHSATKTEQHPNALPKEYQDQVLQTTMSDDMTSLEPMSQPKVGSPAPAQQARPSPLASYVIPAASPARKQQKQSKPTPEQRPVVASSGRPPQVVTTKLPQQQQQQPFQSVPTQDRPKSSPGRPQVVEIPTKIQKAMATAEQSIKQYTFRTPSRGGEKNSPPTGASGITFVQTQPKSNLSTPASKSSQASSNIINPRLLQSTTAFSAKYANNRRGPPPGPDRQRTVRVPTDARGRRQLTSPDKLSSRLLQPTSTSRAHVSKESSSRNRTNHRRSTGASSKSSPIPSRLLQRTETSQMHTMDSPTFSKKVQEEREATKVRVRARIEAQKKKQAERDKGIQERIRKRQEDALSKKKELKTTLARARAKRERMETLERERVEKLKQSIAAKEAKAKAKMAEKENSRPAIPKTMAPRAKLIRPRKVTPTIPIAPSFATDSRFKGRDKPATEEPLPLANSSDIFGKGLRNDTRPAPDKASRRVSSGESRTLTIPKGPKFTTSKLHADKTPTTKAAADKDDNSLVWQGGLRSVSSPTSVRSSGPSKSTIPKTPNFHEIRKRNIAKSTAEKEADEMEYYRKHPFKAKVNKMNDMGSAPRPTKPPVHRLLTLPEPFHFQTDSRIGKSTPKNDREGEFQLFKARPMPDFSSNRNTPLTGRTPPSRRTLTTPEPFKLHILKPTFSGSGGLVIHRPGSKSTPLEPEETYQFKARPIPKFLNHGPPQTITITDSTMGEKQPRQFQARPMPNFGPIVYKSPAINQRLPPVRKEPEELPSPKFRAKPVPKSLSSRPSIPVKHHNPVQLRSPESVRHPEQPTPRAIQFHARPVPKTLSTPSIPVRDRDPSKLRGSPISETSSPSPKIISLSPGATAAAAAAAKFQARPVPRTVTSPSILVRGRDPSKLRSPDYVLNKVHGQQEKGRDPSPQKQSRTMSSPDPKGQSPPKAMHRARTAKDRMRERMKQGGGVPTTVTMSDKTKTQNQITEEKARHMREESRQRKIEAHSMDTNAADSKMELLIATQSWPSVEQGSNTPEDVRAKQEAARRMQQEQQQEAEAYHRSRMADTMKMAYDLKYAAEEELSFHSAIHSGLEQTEQGYRGYNDYE